jgi:hypothetical protein
MAKTTRRTEAAPAEKKPAARRAKVAEPAAEPVKKTVRGTKKTAPAAAGGHESAVAAAPARPMAQTGAPEPSHDEIALRAWSIYQRRGRTHGQAMSDWLQAKTELLLERGVKP